MTYNVFGGTLNLAQFNSIVSLGLLYYYGFTPSFHFDFLGTKFAGKSISDMTNLALSGTFNLNSANHSGRIATSIFSLSSP